jgi:hypothetical protein
MLITTIFPTAFPILILWFLILIRTMTYMTILPCVFWDRGLRPAKRRGDPGRPNKSRRPAQRARHVPPGGAGKRPASVTRHAPCAPHPKPESHVQWPGHGQEPCPVHSTRLAITRATAQRPSDSLFAPQALRYALTRPVLSKATGRANRSAQTFGLSMITTPTLAGHPTGGFGRRCKRLSNVTPPRLRASGPPRPSAWSLRASCWAMTGRTPLTACSPPTTVAPDMSHR